MRLTAILAAALGSALLLAGPGSSQPNASTPPAKAPAAPPVPGPQAHNLDATDVNAFLDGFVPYALKSGDIAGAVVVVVKDGQVLTERGYGFADVEAEKPVDPKVTLFRPGSISKLFAWTAVMQLVEQGKINLDADINQYLDFKIPPRNGQPITMRNLMSHTPGFEEDVKGLIVTDPKRFVKLEPYLKEWTPNRIYPAGEQGAYSNYGAALAGYIVQRLSGEPFDDYVAHHIFQPLGMTRSTFDQPLPANLAPDMAKGYPQASKPAYKYEYVNAAPAGSLAATGDDMGKFMIAHLQDGSYNGAQILKPETAQLMHKEQYVLTPPLPGMALGFYHEDRNGQVIIAHAGDTAVFHSDLHLFLNSHVGLFMSFNSVGKGGAVGFVRTQLFRDFTDRYFPAPVTAPLPTWKDAKADGAKMVGTYIMNRRADSDFMRVLSILGPTKVTMDKDGLLSVSAFKSAPGGAGVRKWREVGHFYWQDVNGNSRMAARFVDGRLIGFTSDDEPPVLLFQPAPSWANPLPLFLSLGYIVMFVLLWPITAWARARYGQRFALEGTPAKTYRFVRIAAIVDVVIVVLWGLVVAGLSGGGNDAILLTAGLAGFLSIVAAAIGLWNLLVVWRDGGRSWFAKVSSLLIALALIVFAWVLFTLHLMGWSTHY
ncbi:MAG TPA: serine hydrolase domain-containing protein [Caulobacteraceae bacterium]|jgi:CubicO group peptidase (beta-lactamase class C family)